MTRTKKNAYLYEYLKLSKETLNNEQSLSYKLYKINEKLDEVIDRLDKQSESLYHIAKYDDYKNQIDDMFDNPIEQIDELIESVKKC